VRNATLRRTDWRFLLPTPCPDLIACGDDATLLECCRRMSTAVRRVATAPPASCDLVVLAAPDATALAHAFTILKPGGACYVEYRGPSAEAGRARAQLMSAGLCRVRAYWPWPSAAKCAAWLPLDSPEAAFGYFDQREEVARLGLGRRILLGRQCRDGRRRQHSGCTGHVSVVGTKPLDTTLDDDTAEAWPLALVARHSGGGVRTGRHRKLHLVLQTGGGRAISKIVGLVFDGADQSRRPALIVKISRIPEAAESLAREAAALREINGVAAMPKGAPQLVFSIRHREFIAVGETALSGLPVEQVLTRRRYAYIATAATDWLIGLALASRAPHVSADVDAIVGSFASNYHGAVAPDLVGIATRHVTAVATLTSVTEHRDFSPWNVFIDSSGQLAVFDWESSVSRGTPGLDLIYFLTYMALTRLGRFRSLLGRHPSYLAAWDRSTPFGRINHQCVERYAGRVGFEASLLPSLRALTWLVHTQSEFRHAAADTAGPPTVTALRRGFFLGLLEQELKAIPGGATQ
jgi:hypothetical protein